MTRPSEPLPYPGDTLPDGALSLRRDYVDILGRPMRGKVRITGTSGAAPVIVKVEGGVLEVALPPDTYTLDAELHTADGFKETRSDVIVLA